MKEQEILHAILQDAKIGWWEADVTARTFRMSGMLCNLLGLNSPEIGLDEFQRFVPEAYRESPGVNIGNFTEYFTSEHIVPLNGPNRPLRLAWKMIHKEQDAAGNIVLTGQVRQVESVPEGTLGSESARINDLLYRLNSISHTLLSLLRTDDAEMVTNKILNELLTSFHGDRAYIIELDFEHRLHTCTYEVTAEGVTSERDFVNFRMDDMLWWTDRMLEGQLITLTTLDDLPSDARVEREVLEAQNIKSMIIMPLLSRDRVWGYAGIDIVDRVHRWTDDDCLWFSSLVNIIGLCLELQRSEQEARDERSYLQALYRHMPLGYVRLKMLFDEERNPVDYEVLDSNYAADKIAGLEREAYVGRRASEMGVDVGAILPGLAEVLHTGEFRVHDTRMVASNRYVHSTLYSIRKDEVICLFTDTTEVREAHEVLYRNEKLLRNIFDNIQVGVELYDCKGNLVDINNKDMEIFGVREKEDVLGVNFYENPNVPVEIRDAVRQGRDQAFRLNYPFDKLGSYYDSGKTGFLEIYTTVNMLYDTQGNLVNFMLINIDNTEINRAHSRLAEFESSFSLVSRFGKVGYCRFDLVTKDGYGVPQWYRNLGETEETPLKEVIGVYSHVDPSDRVAILENIRRVKLREIDNFSLDLRINPGDQESWTRINVMRNPLNNDPSKIEMVCVNFDITELKQTERNLIEAKNKAEVSDRLKSAFLANMSHEIRTPLNAIVGFSSLLTDAEDAEERREYMSVVTENNDLLLKLISDILDLSKIEAGTFDFNYGSVDVNQMCEEAVRSLSLKVEGRPVELLFGSHEPECFMLGDKNRLLQVITNFMNNALKFTEQGSITLGYTVSGNEIHFSVQDTGAGIAEEHRASIFDRFVKLNTFAQGTGLGLSICKSIVEQMGGRIGVDSEAGRGSCFWFTVPIGGREAKNAMEQPSMCVDGRKPVLLIAEDTDSNYLLMSLMLKKEYEIIRACNGEETVRLCREAKPAAILMDIQMPGMDGLEATRQIRAANTAVPIIAVTAFALDRDRQKALDAGCDDYLVKPLTGDQLRQRLRELILGQER